jgi:hypothetical protein
MQLSFVKQWQRIQFILTSCLNSDDHWMLSGCNIFMATSVLRRIPLNVCPYPPSPITNDGLKLSIAFFNLWKREFWEFCSLFKHWKELDGYTMMLNRLNHLTLHESLPFLVYNTLKKTFFHYKMSKHYASSLHFVDLLSETKTLSCAKYAIRMENWCV